MNKNLKGFVFIFALLLTASGCKTIENKVMPGHSEVLIYNLSYDLTYMRAMEALQTVKGWELGLTDKERGLLQVFNTGFQGFGDQDDRKVNFLIRRVNREQTSVQISPEDQHVPGGGMLMERVAEVLNREF